MSFTREYAVKATRKAQRCDGCGTTIQAGEPATRWVGHWDGDFGSAIWHPDCRVAEVALNKEWGTLADEWANLEDMELDDHMWLLDEHPSVADRLGITREGVRQEQEERDRVSAAWRAIDAARRAAPVDTCRMAETRNEAPGGAQVARSCEAGGAQ